MRFAQLDLLKYGRFDDCHLQFAEQSIDLQIVYGPNEAGKSTTMAAVSDLLFGFPHVTPFDFRFDKQLLRVGARLQADGRELTLQRKKGRTGTLLDAQERVADEGALAAMLAGYSTDSFQRMFSLDHTRLRDGGRAILTAQDDVGQAIFAAGSGLVGVTAVLEALEDEAKEIWTKRAGDRRYYSALNAYDEARARQRAAQIKPAAWEDLSKEVERLDGELADLRRRRGEAGREREEIERQRRVLPHAALYRRAQEELMALAEVPDFPADAAEVLEQIATALAAANTETTLAEAERDRTRDALKLIALEPRLIENADDIEALRETKGAVDKNLSDLPRRRADLATRIARLQELQRELAWPTEEASLVKERLPQRVRVAEVRALLEARSALDATLAGAVADETAARQSLEMLQAQLAELPPEKNLGELSAALKFARSLGDIEGVLRTVQRDADRRHAALSQEMAQLLPWSGEIDALRKLILPTDGETATALADAARAEMARADAKRDHQTELNRKSDLELQRLHLVRDDSAVSPQAVHDARQDRDALWRQVRAHLTDENALPDSTAAADDFERRSGIADGMADRRFSAAEQSARLTSLQEEIEHNELALTQQTERVVQANAEVTAVTGDWQGLTTRSGLQMTPKAFGTWSERRRRVLEAAKEHEAALDALKDANAQIQDGRMQLVAALTATGTRPVDETSFAQLIQAAERLEAFGSSEAQQRRELGVTITAATDGLKRVETKLLAARKSIAKWESQWDRSVKAAELHSEASHAVVRSQLELIEELRADVEEILSLQQRITDMDRDVGDFGAQVTALAEACGVKADGRSPADLVTGLASASREAADLQTRHKNLEQQLATAESRLSNADITRARTIARLQPLSEIAGTADRAALSAAVHRAQRARDLREESDRLVDEILKAGAGPELDVLLTEIENAEAPELAVRSSELEEELTELFEEIARLTGDRATAQAKFERLDDGPDAAVAAADAEQARAEMAVQAEAYVRKRAEAALLRWAIAHYRAEKQTPLLRRASDLFSVLTLGHYTNLLVDLEGDKARLAGLAQDQSVVAVDGMSEGTVDQLFLALRLAAVEDAVASGSKLPFLADDLFINYDDNRAAAGFQVLAELAKKTQVIFFTHHQHLLAVAQGALAPNQVSVCTLI